MALFAGSDFKIENDLHTFVDIERVNLLEDHK